MLETTTTRTNHTTYTDHYIYGYADALNEQINLQAFTHSTQYQQGYEDALHDCSFTYTDHDTF